MELSKKSRKGKERREKKRCKEERKRLHWLYSRGKRLQSNFASLGYKTPCLKKKEGRKGHLFKAYRFEAYLSSAVESSH